MPAAQQMARPILAIFDRNYDFTASLQHAWHYEPLVHDVLHMKLNRVDVKPDKNAVKDGRQDEIVRVGRFG